MTARLVLRAALATPLLLAACAAPVPAEYTARGAGFGTVAARTDRAIGRRAVLAQSEAEAAAARREVHTLVHGRTISADTAVQVALLNNKGLQASYAEIGLSAVEAWQQATPANPVVSLGLFGIGTPELGLYRVLEAVVATNLLDARTRPRRVALSNALFQRAQLAAVADTLALADATREAWVNAVAAFETVGYLEQATVAADASSELASQLGRTGALNKADQAREQAFYAELAGQLAQGRLEARLAKEELTRLMGLWGTEVDYAVPDALPPLPGSLSAPRSVEMAALANRVDLEVARLNLAATAQGLGLADATRFASDLELALGLETEREENRGEAESTTAPQVEVAFPIPIYDSGRARLRTAELTYIRAANALAAEAVEVRSEARSAETAYRSTYEIARHYRDVVLPLRATIEEEALLSYSGMITSTFDLLNDTRERLGSELEAAEAKRDFWLAAANLTAAIYGGDAEAGGGGEEEDLSLAAGGADED